ncbi:hypothetical protein MVEN_00130700 [Mycena venus]|uniref:Extracellular serine-rich protein n=1 Tax=Mycena venus TaxID=2733690 RepID=A0A8H6Z7Z1_9AGAR|nr:hypothetical protein MVEN_00130700 [Mycena venus]
MRFALLVATIAAAAVVSAQNQTIFVNVGGDPNTLGGVYQFMPNSITASNGSVITFKFSGIPGNHSITQSTFQSPCQPVEGGFDSGWVEILKNSTAGVFPEWNLTITNNAVPIWFYCKQLIPIAHCIAGMVGVINVKPGVSSLAAFQAAAAKAGSVGQGQNGLVGSGASAAAEPSIQSDIATLHIGPSAAPGGAITLGVSFNLFTIVGGVLTGTAMVL